MNEADSDTLFIEQVWEEHHNLVHWHVWRAVKRYGGEFDELLSEALVLFTDAVQKYEPICGSVQNWIGFCIWHGLQEIKRTEARRLRITGLMGNDLANVFSRDCPIECLEKDLSEESKDVLAVLFSLDEIESYRNKSLAKLTLREALKENKGWTNAQINRCFKEIEEAL